MKKVFYVIPFLGFLFFLPTAHAAISFVQSANSNSAYSGSAFTATAAFNNSVTAGDLIVVAITTTGYGSPAGTISDSVGNTFVLAGTSVCSGSACGYDNITNSIYYAANVKSGSDTVSFKWATAPSWSSMAIQEYAGINTASPLDQFENTAASAATTVGTGNVTVNAAPELLFSVLGTYSACTASPTVSSGWATRADSFSGTGNACMITADQIVSAAGTYANTFGGLAANSPLNAAIATFTAAGSSATSVPPAGTSGDVTPPVASIATPANGATVTGTVNVSVTASDNVGVTKVEFYLDSALQTTDTATPYVWAWNTATAGNGSHTLMAKAYDAAGNMVTAGTVTITVNNATTVTPPPVAAPAGTTPWSGILDPSRAISWSNAGVIGGIPSRATICATVQASTYGNGSSDATAGIQNALNNCAAGQAVLLSSGTFLIDSYVLVPSNVTLRGSGANQTIINANGSGGGPVQLGTPGAGPTASQVSGSPSVTGGATAGSTSVTVSSASGIATGQYLIVSELNDPNFVSIAGGEGNCTWCDIYWSGTRARGQIVQVTSVSGNTVNFTPALYSAYSHTPLVTPFSAGAGYAGVEDLQVQANNTGYTADFQMNACANCWIMGVESNYTDGDFVQLHLGYHDTVRDSYFSNSYVHTPGSTDSDIFIADKTSASLVENNIVERGHAAIMINWGAAGNVVSYNYTEGGFDSNAMNSVGGGIGFHGADPQYNLLEGNVVEQIHPDEIWGSSSDNTLFRNWARGTTIACNPLTGRSTVACSPVGSQGSAGINGWWEFQGSRAISIDHLSLYYNLVGDLSGSPQQNALLAYGTNQTSHVALLEYPSTRSYDSINYNLGFGYGESADDGTGTGCDGSTVTPCHSTTAFSTALLYNEYTYANGATNCFSNGSASTCSTALPASFYLSGKPSWWGSLPFPAIGPDVTSGSQMNGHANLIPAENCYLNVMDGSEGGNNSPLTFNATNCYGAGSGAGSGTGSGTGTTSDTIPPTISITAPSSGATVSGTVAVSATAADNVGVTQVQFYLDGTLQATDATSPYAWSWNTANAGNGSHTLTAIAYDAAGNTATAGSITVTVNNVTAPTGDTTPPSVPTGLTTTVVSMSQINVYWTASTDNVGVTGYQLYRNGVKIGTTPVASYADTDLVPGTTYTYTISAYDAAGNASPQSSAVTATTQSAADSVAPTATLTGPNDSSTVSGTVLITANASDNVGVVQVQFALDGVALGAPVTIAPYQVYWNTLLSGNGTHTLRAVAYDAAGNAGNSQTVTVTAQNVPTVTLAAPTNGATLAGTAQLSAVASSSGGDPVVQFVVDGVDFGTPVAAPPYQIYWNTLGVTNGTHTIRAKATDVGGNQTISPVANVTVTNNPATPLTVSLLVSAANGTAPLTVTLTAQARATANGTYNYTLYCNDADTTTTVTASYNAMANAVGANSYVASNLCIYTKAGTYTPKVIVQQGTTVAEAQGTVVVTAPSTPRIFRGGRSSAK